AGRDAQGRQAHRLRGRAALLPRGAAGAPGGADRLHRAAAPLPRPAAGRRADPIPEQLQPARPGGAAGAILNGRPRILVYVSRAPRNVNKNPRDVTLTRTARLARTAPSSAGPPSAPGSLRAAGPVAGRRRRRRRRPAPPSPRGRTRP